MTTAPAILDPRKAWLERRRTLLTASDVAAVLGQDERRGPLAVYAAKVGGVESDETLPMRRGRRMEAAIADEYADETGRLVQDLGAYEIAIHPDISWLGATLDRVTTPTLERPAPEGCRGQGPGPLQIKLAIGSARDWKEGPPLGHQIQVQMEIACFGAAWGSLAGLVGPGPLAIHDFPRHDAFLASALPRLEEFWARVQRQDPPEADALPGTTHAIKRLWSTDDGATIDLNPEDLQLADDWEGAKLGKADAEKRLQELENKLRLRLRLATFGALPDGTFLTLRTIKNQGYTNVVEPYTYRTLRRLRPRIRRR